MTIEEFYAVVRRITDRAVRGGHPGAASIRHVVGECEFAEEDHMVSDRQYAHSLHVPNTVCWCKASLDLPETNIMGIAAHEIAHVLRGEGLRKKDRDRDEAATDFWALNHLGVEIDYDEKEVQFVRAFHDQEYLKNMEDES